MIPRAVRTTFVAAVLGLAPSAGMAQDTVRVLAYNIRHGAGMDQQLDLERTAEVIRALQPDVVLLQEVDSGAARTNGVDQAHHLAGLTGLPHYVFGRFMDYDGGAYGMAALSASPILRHENHVLPEGAEPRSALAVRIRPAPTSPEIVFVGIHLYRTASERYAQAKRLLEAFGAETAPVVLVGDFNSQPGDAVMRLLGTQWKLPAKPTAAHFTFPADAPRREIDYALYRPDDAFTVVEYRGIEEPLASDHRPVLIVLAVSKSKR
jgi:endonuclease/exonuclease/phosphatase family metal-dependent hydrolase